MQLVNGIRGLGPAAALGMAMLWGLAIAPVQAGDPYMLREGSWVCRSPETYDIAMARLRGGKGGTSLVRAELVEEKLCMFIDDEYLEDTMAPFYQIQERDGDKVKVLFTVEFYKKIEYLHRRITRITFAGWTHEDNLVPGTWYQ